jgi:hypothetical protein
MVVVDYFDLEMNNDCFVGMLRMVDYKYIREL